MRPPVIGTAKDKLDPKHAYNREWPKPKPNTVRYEVGTRTKPNAL